MKADQDIGIEGAQVHAGNNVTLDAGRDLTVESATGAMRQDTDSMSVAAGGGIKANVGANGVGVGANAYASGSGSKSDYESTYNRNAVVKAEKELSTTSGRDTTVAGAHLQGETVTMDVGGRLDVASRQDKSEGSSSSVGGSVDVMIGAGASGSLSANVGKGKNSSGWVGDQTTIIGEEKVDIRVEDNTHVEGAVIAAKNGNLKLDTNTLTYADIHDHDKASNINVGVSVSGSYGGGGYSTQKSWDSILGTESGSKAAATKTGADDDSDKGLHSPSGSVSVDYSSKDRRQINRATIGEGTIIIRSDPNAGLEGLNRDLARAQEITKDSETAVSVYIDSAVLKEISSGFKGIREDSAKIGDALSKAIKKLQASPTLGKQEAAIFQNTLELAFESTSLSKNLSQKQKEQYIEGITKSIEGEYLQLRESGLDHLGAMIKLAEAVQDFARWADSFNKNGLQIVTVGGNSYVALPGFQKAVAGADDAVVLLGAALIVGALSASTDTNHSADVASSLMASLKAVDANASAIKYIPGYKELTNQAIVQFSVGDGVYREVVVDDIRMDEAGRPQYARDSTTGYYYRLYGDGTAIFTDPMRMNAAGQLESVPGYADGSNVPHTSTHDNTQPALPGTNTGGYTADAGDVDSGPLVTPDQGEGAGSTHVTPDQGGEIDNSPLVNGDRPQKLAPAESPIWKGLKSVGGKTRTNGLSGKSKRLYQWDHTHGDIEVYDGNGRHLGSMEPVSGEMYKPAVKGRIIGK